MSTPSLATHQPAAPWREPLLLLASVFAACLLGIASRPAGYSAAIWPANAVLLGLLLRNPAWVRSPAAWMCALAGYLTADMLTGAPWLRALGMNGANLLGVWAGWLFLKRHAATLVGFARPRAVLTLLAGSTVTALGSALPGTPVMQWAFASPPWTDLLMWLSSEMYNLLLFLPLVLAAPRGWFWQWDWARLLRPLRRAGLAPLLALLACEALAYFVNGPGMLGFAVPALVWCAMAYGVFPITVLNLLVCSWKTAVAALDTISFLPDQLAAVTSFRLGVALLVAGAAGRGRGAPAALPGPEPVAAGRGPRPSDRRAVAAQPDGTGRPPGAAPAPAGRARGRAADGSGPLQAHQRQPWPRPGRHRAARVRRPGAAQPAPAGPVRAHRRRGVRPDPARHGGQPRPADWRAPAHPVARTPDSHYQEGGTLQVTLSVGLHATQPPGPPESLERLLACADAALYQAKALGRDQVRGHRADQG